MRIFHHFIRSEDIHAYIDLTPEDIQKIIKEAEIENAPADLLLLDQDQLQTIFEFATDTETAELQYVGQETWYGNSDAEDQTLDYQIQNLEDDNFEVFPHSTEWIVRQDQIVTFEIKVTAPTARAAMDQVKNNSIFENGTTIKVTPGPAVAAYRKGAHS